MFPMDRNYLGPAVEIEYDGRGGVRTRKRFEDCYEARRFYGAKLRAGKNPKVCKAGGVDTEATQAKETNS